MPLNKKLAKLSDRLFYLENGITGLAVILIVLDPPITIALLALSLVIHIYRLKIEGILNKVFSF